MEKKNKKRVTPLKVLRNILIVIVAVVVVFICVLRVYFRAPVNSYYRNSMRAFVIPGTNDGYIAQGIAYDKSSGNFYLTGYMNDSSASPIYLVNKASKKLVKTIKMANPDGSEFTGHSGGISIYGNKVFVAGGKDECLFVFDKASIDSAENGASVKYIDTVSFKTPNDDFGVAYTTTHEGLLYAGEFYRVPNYPALESHQVPVSDGSMNHALAIGFELDGNIPNPIVAYSVPDNVQGMCFGEDGIYLTTSWAVGFSYVYKYAYTELIQKGTKVVLGKEVPLYVLEQNGCTELYKLPPMAEEIEYVDGLYYVNNESASNKYIFGKFTGGQFCYATKF